MRGKTDGKRKRGQQRMRCLDSITDSMDTSLSKLRETVEARGAWCASAHAFTKSQTRLNDWATATFHVCLCFTSLTNELNICEHIKAESPSWGRKARPLNLFHAKSPTEAVIYRECQEERNRDVAHSEGKNPVSSFLRTESVWKRANVKGVARYCWNCFLSPFMPQKQYRETKTKPKSRVMKILAYRWPVQKSQTWLND